MKLNPPENELSEPLYDGPYIDGPTVWKQIFVGVVAFGFLFGAVVNPGWPVELGRVAVGAALEVWNTIG